MGRWSRSSRCAGQSTRRSGRASHRRRAQFHALGIAGYSRSWRDGGLASFSMTRADHVPTLAGDDAGHESHGLCMPRPGAFLVRRSTTVVTLASEVYQKRGKPMPEAGRSTAKAHPAPMRHAATRAFLRARRRHFAAGRAGRNARRCTRATDWHHGGGADRRAGAGMTSPRCAARMGSHLHFFMGLIRRCSAIRRISVRA